MAELLFIATTIFVAYVIYVVVNDEKELAKAHKTEADKTTATTPPVTATDQIESTVESVVSEAVAIDTPASESPESDKSTEASTQTASDSIRNPKTGEISKIPSNYTFAKRWIKEALVTEGLLDKVYKNADLTDEINDKIHHALLQLQALKKYQ